MIELILRAIEMSKKLPAGSLVSKRRGKDIIKWRYVAALYLRERFELSYPDLGRIFHRDHSTIVHGVKKMKKTMAQQYFRQAEVSLLFEEIDGKLQQMVVLAEKRGAEIWKQ